jgi:outer membrane protein TolC
MPVFIREHRMSYRIKSVCFAIALLLLTRSAMAQQFRSTFVEELTLEDAVKLALEENRQIEIARLEVRKFDDRLAAAKTHRLPKLQFSALGAELIRKVNFDFKRGDLGALTGIGPVPEKDVTVTAPRRPAFFVNGSVFQPLTQQYRLSLVDRKIEIGQEIADQQLRAKELEIANNVKKAYYALLQSQSALDSVQEELKLFRELDRVTDQHLVQQVVLKADSLQVKTRVQGIIYQEMILRDQLSDEKEKLNTLLGRHIDTEFRVSAAPEPSLFEMDLSEARRGALAQRPELREAELKVQAAEYERRIKKSEYIPDLSVGIQFSTNQNIKVLPDNIFQAGFLLTWEPFDWGRKRREMDEIAKGQLQASTALSETKDKVLVEVGDQFRKLRQSRQFLVTAALAQETARENVRVLNVRYSEQETLFKDVLQAQSSLAEADHQYQQALLSFWTAKADFEKAVGSNP